MTCIESINPPPACLGPNDPCLVELNLTSLFPPRGDGLNGVRRIYIEDRIWIDASGAFFEELFVLNFIS